jgi:hypothetical protein
MRKLNRSLIELQPAHRAVLLEIICHARLGDTQVLGQAFFQPRHIFAATATPEEIADGNSQGLT